MSKFGIFNILYIAGFIFISQLVYYGNTSLLSILILVLTYLIILILGVLNVGWEFFMEIENAGNARTNKIALSFDDGPNPEFTQKVLDRLDQHEVKSIFFCIGNNIETNPNLLQEIYKRGHLIGNHSYRHQNNFPILSTNSIEKELQDCNQIISDIIGLTPLFFRPPFGVTNPRIARAVKRLNLVTVGWSLRTFDTSKPPSKVIRKIKKTLSGGDIVLLHDNHKGVLEILDFLIPYAHQNGLKIVRPDELIEKDAYEIHD